MKLSRKNLAQLFDVSIRTITTWQNDPSFPQPTKESGVNVYDGPAIVAWWHARELARLVETDDGTLLDPAQERARLDQAKRLRTELETARLEGELVNAAAAGRQFRHASNVTRNSILGVPTRIAPVIAAMTDVDECHDMMITELENALSTLADRAEQHVADAAVGIDARSSTPTEDKPQ